MTLFADGAIFLPKPYTKERLAEALEKSLSTSQSGLSGR